MVDPHDSRIDRHLPIPQIYDDLYSFLHCSPFLVFTEKKSQVLPSDLLALPWRAALATSVRAGRARFRLPGRRAWRPDATG